MAGNTLNGRNLRRDGHLTAVRACLVFCLVVAAVAPAAAWTVPGVDGNCRDRFHDSSTWTELIRDCTFSAQLKPAGVLVGGEEELGTGYYDDTHVYAIENAIRLLKEKGYDNWALYLSSPDQFQALADGVTWADAYKGRTSVHLSIYVLFVEVWSDDFDICNYAGFDQYYNSYDSTADGKGLDSEGIDVLANYLPVLIKTIGPAIVEIAGSLVGFPGLGGLLAAVSADINPTLDSSYPSGAVLAQDHYDKAINYYFKSATDPATGKNQLYLPGRSSEYNSLFQLGWSAHLIQDIGVIYHMRDIGSSFPPNPHNDFEDDAKGMGDPYDKDSADFHVHAGNWALGTDYTTKTVKELARNEALYINSESDWQAARSQDATIRKPVVQKGVKASEQFTAAILAKYMAETGIPKVKKPFQGRVEGVNNQPVPYAFVFYRKGKECIQDPDTPAVCGAPRGAWNYVRADKNGKFVLNLRPGDKSLFDTYLIRPAMPGYRYTGYQSGESSEMMGAIIDGTPLEYQPPWKTLAVTSNPYYEFYLTPLSGTQNAGGLPAVAGSPSVLIPVTSDISLATASAIRDNIMETTAESTVLRIRTGDSLEQLVLSLPDESYIEVLLSNLVSLDEQKVVMASTEIAPKAALVKKQGTGLFTMQVSDNVMANYSLLSNKVEPVLLQDLYVPASSREKWQIVLDAAPKKEIKDSAGKVVKVPDLSYVLGSGPVSSATALISNGMARIPAKGAQIEITLASGPGYIGPEFTDTTLSMVALTPGDKPYETLSIGDQQKLIGTVQPGSPDCAGSTGCPDSTLKDIPLIAGKGTQGSLQPQKKSLILTTDSDGKAAIRLKTGSQPGKIQLDFKVIKNPDAPGILPADTVELMVHPAIYGTDSTQVILPAIEVIAPEKVQFSEITGYIITPAEQEKSPVMCFNITPDGSATVETCPVKQNGIVSVTDFISSILNAFGNLFQPVEITGKKVLAPAEGSGCDDSNSCTVRDRYINGICEGEPVVCNDNRADTEDSCNPREGCVFTPIGEAPVLRECDDRNLCSVNDVLVNGVCEGEPVVCNDNRADTEDSCNPREGCVFTPIREALVLRECDDRNLCSVNDVLVNGVCEGEPVVCNDNRADTEDSCNPREGCVFTPIGEAPVLRECDDRNLCTINDVLVNGVCEGEPVVCNDNRADTEDSCDPQAGCVFMPVRQRICPDDCSCFTESEAEERFGTYTRCSDEPCGTIRSDRTGSVIMQYCFRPAARMTLDSALIQDVS